MSNPALRSEGQPPDDNQGLRVTAVIPTLNEEDAIGAVVASVPRSLVSDVVVVDGGSADRTAERAAGAGARVVVEPRPGYGRACLTGAAASQHCDVLLFVDGDGSDAVEQAERLILPIAAGEADLVLGSRTRGHLEPGALGIHQRVGNRLVATILNRRHSLSLTDIGPFRAIRREVFDAVDLQELTYGLPTEMIRNVACTGYRIREVPVDYRRRAGGVSKVSGSPRGSLLAGWHMVRIATQ
jgi:glycosyltransferase involved in cell wall biosynthesis